MAEQWRFLIKEENLGSFSAFSFFFQFVLREDKKGILQPAHELRVIMRNTRRSRRQTGHSRTDMNIIQKKLWRLQEATDSEITPCRTSYTGVGGDGKGCLSGLFRELRGQRVVLEARSVGSQWSIVGSLVGSLQAEQSGWCWPNRWAQRENDKICVNGQSLATTTHQTPATTSESQNWTRCLVLLAGMSWEQVYKYRRLERCSIVFLIPPLAN